MTWTPLAQRLPTLPLVLAGPIVRRTEPSQVTVWLALKQACAITLVVYATDGMTERMVGSRYTVKLGPNLHVVAAAARAEGQRSELAWGGLYTYDVFFQTLSSDPQGDTPPAPVSSTPPHLSTPGIVNTGSYSVELRPGPTPPQQPLPSFVLPPNNVEQLRIVHGSCRKPHGPGPDALQALGMMIDEAPADPLRRPHQLFFTGDQIYADDVASMLLFMLRDAADALLGYREQIPGVDEAHLVPRARTSLMPLAGFTTSYLAGRGPGLGQRVGVRAGSARAGRAR